MFLNTANFLKKRRHELNISQRDLVKLMGKETKYVQVISNIERGLAGIPLQSSYEYSKALNVGIDEIKKVYLADMSNKFDIQVKISE